MDCEFCKTNCKNLYNLNLHLTKSKKCLKIRGLQLNTKYVCNGCNTMYSNNANLNIHKESCKEFALFQLEEKFKSEIDKLKEENQSLKQYNEKTIFDMKQHYEKVVLDMKQNYEKSISDIAQLHEKEKLFLQKQLDRIHNSYDNIAKEAVNRPTTTNNTVNNIRNILSTKHTIDQLLHDDLILVFKKSLTEDVLLGGQPAIAKICSENIVQTTDNKMLICCTDKSRDKFKYMDSNGNIKEDFQARHFTSKIIKPLEEVGQEVYDTAITTITEQKNELGPIEYGKKDSLNAREHRLAISLMELRGIDLTEYNSKFLNEFAILTKSA